ncbi:MAG: hypothetical protein JST42_11835 [Bacteroidetes bacterium]|nr:hypothetical protein [Bacteroidota bacterium]
MKKMIGLTMGFMMASAVLFAQTSPHKAPTKAKMVYTCPMHPDVTSEKPGKCPKCGMTLVAKKPAPGAAKPGGGHMKKDTSMKSMKM